MHAIAMLAVKTPEFLLDYRIRIYSILMITIMKVYCYYLVVYISLL